MVSVLRRVDFAANDSVLSLQIGGRLIQLTVGLAISTALVAGCGFGKHSSSCTASPNSVQDGLQGWVYAPDAISGAKLDLYDMSGKHICGLTPQTVNSGIFVTSAKELPSDFRIVATGGKQDHVPFKGTLSADVRGYHAMIPIHINLVTTLVADYRDAHPSSSQANSELVVKRFLGIPQSVEVGREIDTADEFFDSHLYLRTAAKNGGVDAYGATLVKEMSNPKARHFFVGPPHNQGLVVAAGKFVAEQLVVGALRWGGGEAAAKIAGDLGLGSPDPTQTQLTSIQNTLTDVSSDLQTMSVQLSDLKEQISDAENVITSDIKAAERLSTAQTYSSRYDNYVTQMPDTTEIDTGAEMFATFTKLAADSSSTVTQIQQSDAAFVSWIGANQTDIIDWIAKARNVLNGQAGSDGLIKTYAQLTTARSVIWTAATQVDAESPIAFYTGYEAQVALLMSEYTNSGATLAAMWNDIVPTTIAAQLIAESPNDPADDVNGVDTDYFDEHLAKATPPDEMPAGVAVVMATGRMYPLAERGYGDTAAIGGDNSWTNIDPPSSGDGPWQGYLGGVSTAGFSDWDWPDIGDYTSLADGWDSTGSCGIDSSGNLITCTSPAQYLTTNYGFTGSPLDGGGGVFWSQTGSGVILGSGCPTYSLYDMSSGGTGGKGAPDKDYCYAGASQQYWLMPVRSIGSGENYWLPAN